MLEGGEKSLQEKGRREEAEVEECDRCQKYDVCNKPRDENYTEIYCMNGGAGCLYKPTREERRMEIWKD